MPIHVGLQMFKYILSTTLNYNLLSKEDEVHIRLRLWFASVIRLTLIAAYSSVESQENLFSVLTDVANL